MSSLIFHTEENQVIIATDTLATTVSGEPALFTTKSFILPHLQMIIAGTGVAGFLGKWFIRLNSKMLTKGIDNLDYHTPNVLAEIWNNHKVESNIPDDITATIYHFGFSEESGVIHIYVYRSINNFQSEQITQYGIGVKPACTIPDNYELPKDFKTMMDEQRSIQSSLPKDERIYIGGKIQIHHLQKQGFSVYTLDKFEDYDEIESAMNKNFHSSQN